MEENAVMDDAGIRTPSNNAARFGRSDLLMILAVLFWGVNLSVIKIGLREFTPHAFNGLRFGLASLVYAAWLFLKRPRPEFRKGDGLRIAGLGLAGVAVYQVFFINGLARETVSTSAVIMAMTPIFIALLSSAFRFEKIAWAGWLGIGLSFAGLAVVMNDPAESFAWDGIRGDLMILAANICWAVYTVFGKPILARMAAVHLAAMTTIVGTALYLPFAARDLIRLEWRDISPSAWGAVIYSAIFAVVISFAVWYASVQRVGNAKTGIYGNLIPIFAAVSAAVILSEKLTPRLAAGAAVILLGVYLTRSGYRFFEKKSPEG